MNKIYIICYNALDVYDSKEEAINFYNQCSKLCKGNEKQRYETVVNELKTKNIATDNISTYCDKINIFDNDKFENGITLNLDYAIDKDEIIEYYEKRVNPILKVSNDYGIDLKSEIPFQDFGDDNESYNMSSFSNYYKELLTNIGFKIDDVKTNSLSDGKYRLIVNNKNQIDITAWDNLDNIVDNVERIYYLFSLDNENIYYEEDDNYVFGIREENQVQIEDAKKMGKGWFWIKYYDGSGNLQSPDGKEYMEYDLNTNEYKETPKSRWEFFPLNYYYADGYKKEEFKPFEYMEEEMIKYVLPREKEHNKELEI